MDILHEESSFQEENPGVSEKRQDSEEKEGLVTETSEECSEEGGVAEVGYELQNPQQGGQTRAIFVHQLPRKGLSFQLWPAATALCWYLDHTYGNSGMQVASSSYAIRGVGGKEGEEVSGVKRRRLRVLELGAGTGMVGVLAARLGAHVTLTDLAHVLPNLEQNVELNKLTVEAGGGSLSVHLLQWGVKEDVTALGQEPFDLILASDVVYYDTLFEPLVKTLKWLVGASPVVLLAHLRRWKKDKHFFRMASKFFHLEVVHQHPPPENYRTGVVVYRLTRHKYDKLGRASCCSNGW
ncbi:unnamed protein product [Sphagnum jensenii]|uniref:Uncharacterized protein n=1 Tax=Sphagnum jensenii TaxID=128206 RepID=A0ABP0X2K1_9BRYO